MRRTALIGLAAARNLAPAPLAWSTRSLIALLRSFHPVIVAIVFVKALGFGALSGIAASYPAPNVTRPGRVAAITIGASATPTSLLTQRNDAARRGGPGRGLPSYPVGGVDKWWYVVYRGAKW